MSRLNGWIPDRPDHRDRHYGELRPQGRLFRALSRPGYAYLRSDLLPVTDQGPIGSCVGNGVALACDYVEGKQGRPELLSRLAIYYWARGGVPEDTGATIRDGVKAVARNGAPLEYLWPYDVTKWRQPPSNAAVCEGAHRAVGIEYYRLDTLSDILDCVAQGFPVVFGTTLFPQFEDVKNDGIVKMPGPHDAPIGGHCMVIVGYATKMVVDGHKGAVFVRNSWGRDWGMSGSCWLSFEYLKQFAADYWTIRRIAP